MMVLNFETFPTQNNNSPQPKVSIITFFHNLKYFQRTAISSSKIKHAAKTLFYWCLNFKNFPSHLCGYFRKYFKSTYPCYSYLLWQVIYELFCMLCGILYGVPSSNDVLKSNARLANFIHFPDRTSIFVTNY